MWLKYTLLALGVGHLIFGVYALSAPLQVAGLLSLSPATPGASGEIRAVFGGLAAAMGVAILRGARRGPAGRQWLLLLALAFAGLVLGRVASLAGDGFALHTVLSMILEGGIAAILLYAAGEAGGAGGAPRSAPGATSGGAG